VSCKVVKAGFRSYASCETQGLTLSSQADWVYLMEQYGVNGPVTQAGHSQTASLTKEQYDKIAALLVSLDAKKMADKFNRYTFAYVGGYTVLHLFEQNGKHYVNNTPGVGDLTGFVGKIPITVLYSDGADDPDAECKQWKERALVAESHIAEIEKFLSKLFKGEFGVTFPTS